MWELEKARYITRQQNRNDKGKMADMVYTIYKQRQPRPEAPWKIPPRFPSSACGSMEPMKLLQRSAAYVDTLKRRSGIWMIFISICCGMHIRPTVSLTGQPPRDVQELLGHSDVGTTINIYAHAIREAKRTSARLLDKVVGTA